MANDKAIQKTLTELRAALDALPPAARARITKLLNQLSQQYGDTMPRAELGEPDDGWVGGWVGPPGPGPKNPPTPAARAKKKK